MENGQESGGFVSLLDTNMRTAFFIELDCFEGRSTLVSGRSLGPVPDEVAETITAQKTVDRWLAFEIFAGDSYSILPADDVRVTTVELPTRHFIH